MKKDQYRVKVEAVEKQLTKLKSKSRTYLLLKLLTFSSFLYLGWNVLMPNSTPLYTIGCALSFSAYVFVMFIDSRLQKRILFIQNRKKVLDSELAYLMGDFSSFDDGSEFVDSEHPYSFDLDVFGNHSYFHRINRTVSSLGKEKLAYYLGNLDLSKDEIYRRQESIKELRDLEEWRLDFLTYGQDAAFDLKRLLNVQGEATSKARMLSVGAKIFMVIFPALTIGSLILSIFDVLPGSVAGFLFAVQILICILFSKVLNHISMEIGGLFKGFKSYRNIFKMILEEDFKSEELKMLQKQLFISKELNVLSSFKNLARLLDNMDQRGNLIIFILTNGFYLRDLWLIRSYYQWREVSKFHLANWVRVLTDIDAIVSLSTNAYNNSDRNFATIVSDDSVVFKAKGCYHPFLKREVAVANDFDLIKGDFAIVTGANMAGKSTFLRSVGINLIMALNGLPVCAESLTVSTIKLFSSMRTSDNLVKNMSYFNAELTRLGTLISYCKENKHTLIILDEILKGTNSADKLNGSRLFLSEISKLAVTGIIATHDLALSELSNKEAIFKNLCFEIELSDNIDYTYKISEGVARNMNATHLLHQIIDKINN